MAETVMEATAARFGLTVQDLKCQRRSRPYARARQVAMFCIRRLCPHMSYPEIGRRMGGRDHTTILHGERKVAGLMAEGLLVEDVEAILATFPIDEALEAEIEEAKATVAETQRELSESEKWLAWLVSRRPKPMQVAA